MQGYCLDYPVNVVPTQDMRPLGTPTPDLRNREVSVTIPQAAGTQSKG